MRYTEIKNLENEEWRPIEGFDGRYYVSNYGRVKSHLRHGYNQIPCEAYAHLLTPVILKIGYPSVVLWKKGKSIPITFTALWLLPSLANCRKEWW